MSTVNIKSNTSNENADYTKHANKNDGKQGMMADKVDKVPSFPQVLPMGTINLSLLIYADTV